MVRAMSDYIPSTYIEFDTFRVPIMWALTLGYPASWLQSSEYPRLHISTWICLETNKTKNNP